MVLWVAAFGVAERFEDRERADVATLDAIAVAPHFMTLVSVLELKRELGTKCSSDVCWDIEPSWSWTVPPAVCLVFDALTVRRVHVFYNDVPVFWAAATTMMASSLASLAWCATVYDALLRGHESWDKGKRVRANKEISLN